MKNQIAILIVVVLFVTVGVAATDPYESLTPAEKALLKPQIERWIHDQIKHDWSDMWEIQGQTPTLKNECYWATRTLPIWTESSMCRQCEIPSEPATQK